MLRDRGHGEAGQPDRSSQAAKLISDANSLGRVPSQLSMRTKPTSSVQISDLQSRRGRDDAADRSGFQPMKPAQMQAGHAFMLIGRKGGKAPMSSARCRPEDAY